MSARAELDEIRGALYKEYGTEIARLRELHSQGRLEEYGKGYNKGPSATTTTTIKSDVSSAEVPLSGKALDMAAFEKSNLTADDVKNMQEEVLKRLVAGQEQEESNKQKKQIQA
eukprot:PhM_4_TR17885/c0_g1_i1/m.35671